ncbi:MAG: hypothetical protein ACRC0N_08560 [Acinetobacter johnsonii]
MDEFEEAWKENRHVWESTKNLAKAMYLAGQQSRQAEVDDLQKKIDEVIDLFDDHECGGELSIFRKNIFNIIKGISNEH